MEGGRPHRLPDNRCCGQPADYLFGTVFNLMFVTISFLQRPLTWSCFTGCSLETFDIIILLGFGVPVFAG